MWEKVKLGDFLYFEKKSKVKAGEGKDNGIFPFFTSSSILNKFINEFQFSGPSLILGTGGKASIHYYDNKFSVSTDCFVLKCKEQETFNTKFIFHYLSGNIFLLEEGFKGAGLKHISKDYISNLEIPLPPLHIQEKIAEILDKADELRRKDQELQDKYDQLAQAIFIDMFGDYLNSSNNCLLDFIELNPKKSEINEEKKLEVSFIPMASVGENGQLNLSQTKIIEDVYSGFTYFREDDVLFAKITPCMENGKGAIARNLKNKIGFGSTEFHVLRPTKQLNSTFIYYLLSLKNIRKFAEINMSGSAGQKRVPASFFSKINLNAPPIHL